MLCPVGQSLTASPRRAPASQKSATFSVLHRHRCDTTAFLESRGRWARGKTETRAPENEGDLIMVALHGADIEGVCLGKAVLALLQFVSENIPTCHEPAYCRCPSQTPDDSPQRWRQEETKAECDLGSGDSPVTSLQGQEPFPTERWGRRFPLALLASAPRSPPRGRAGQKRR
jgi:hypothetical protein